MAPRSPAGHLRKYFPGQKYTMWTLVRPAPEVGKGRWHCKCDCGTERVLFTPDLSRGRSTSCGCKPMTQGEIDARSKKIWEVRYKNAERRKIANEKARKKREEKKAAELAANPLPPPPPPKQEPEKKGAFITRYGMKWEAAKSTEFSIEFYCYSHYNDEGFKTGVPREHHLKKAFMVIWPDYQWNEWCELMTWAWCNYRLVCIIGHSRASKTYHIAHLALLDYLGESLVTATTLTTTKFDALKSRMWGDMMRAAESMRPEIFQNFIQNYKITNTSNEMRISSSAPDRHGDDKFMIQGVATDSADKSAGKIRGQHANRRRIIVDEAQDVAPAIYTAFSNAVSAPDFLGVLLSNPVEKLSPFGEWCKPKGGWGSVHDTDTWWETEKPHGICLHFDGLRSPNIKAGKTLFPYLLTQDYIDTIRATNGEGSLEWWMYIRGFFPPDGTVSRVWPSAAIERGEQDVEFDFPPTACATLDPAFEFDDPVIHFGLQGRTRESKPCIRATESVRIKYKEGTGEFPKDYQLAREAIRLCKERGVPPENFIMDTTGNGRGVFAIIQIEWSTKVQGINYGGEATERPMRLNDPKPAKDQVRYFVAELWFRASFLAQDGMLCGLKNVSPKTTEDLTARRYTIKQMGDKKLMVVETKDEMKSRLGRSPDYGDAFVGFGELMVRKGLLGDIPGAKNTGKGRWDALRKLARKASARFSEAKQFAHHG